MARLKGLPKRLAAMPRAVGFVDRKEAERARDRVRAKTNPLRHLYWSDRWRSLRFDIAERDGWMCQGCGVPHQLNTIRNHPDSLVVDHKEPHKGNLVLFWDEENLQAVCKAYHDGEKQRLEQAAHAAARKGGWG